MLDRLLERSQSEIASQLSIATATEQADTSKQDGARCAEFDFARVLQLDLLRPFHEHNSPGRLNQNTGSKGKAKNTVNWQVIIITQGLTNKKPYFADAM